MSQKIRDFMTGVPIPPRVRKAGVKRATCTPQLIAGLPTFTPRWRNALSGHLHTAAAFSNSHDCSLDTFNHQRMLLPTADGTNDTLVAHYYRPLGRSQKALAVAPLVVLLHGLAGSAESIYIRRAAVYLLTHGYDVLAFNFRGAGDSTELSSNHNSPGSTEDLDFLLQGLKRIAPHAICTGAVVVGYSLGGNILLKYLAQDLCDNQVRAAMTISAPIDLAATSQRLGEWQNMVYRIYLLKKLRARLLGDPTLTEREKNTVRSLTSIRDLDARFVAPRNGYSSVERYYMDNSAIDSLANIRIGTLLLCARDDPFLIRDTYEKYDWQCNPYVQAFVTDHGGHTGFCSNDTDHPWLSQSILQLVESVASR